MSETRQAGLPSAFWLGGGCGAGKTTVARAVTRRLDLRLYPVDAYTYEHAGRSAAGHCPQHQKFTAMSPDQQWLAAPRELAETFVAISAERLEMVYDDLRALGSGPTVVVEGPQLFPDLIAPVLQSPEHALWLIPSAEFGQRGVEQRGLSFKTRQQDQARLSRHQRDLLLTGLHRQQAAARHLLTAEVDGSRSVAQMVALVSARLEQLPGGLIRAADGRELQQMRRAENAVVVRQLLAWWQDMGAARMPDAPVFDFSCECESLGCEQVAAVAVTDYQHRSASGPVTVPGPRAARRRSCK